MKRKWLAVAGSAAAVVAAGAIGVALVTSGGNPAAGVAQLSGGTGPNSSPISIPNIAPSTTARSAPAMPSSGVRQPVTLLATPGRPVPNAPQPSATPVVGPPAESVTRQVSLGVMPMGTVVFGRGLAVSVDVVGLTPGSAHTVEIDAPGKPAIALGVLQANATGQANAVLSGPATQALPAGSMLTIRLGTPAGGAEAAEIIAETSPLAANPMGLRYPLRAIGPDGALSGAARITYDPVAHTVTIQLAATGLTPGAHAVHIHVGSCAVQGPPKYMPAQDFVADARGEVANESRTIPNVPADPLTNGFYLNIHQGSSATIVRNGAVTPEFRPLLCADLP